MKGLIIDLEVPYFSTFRKTTSSSLIMSYSAPPFTTIRGMFANAYGLMRDDLSLQDHFKLGIRILNPGYRNCEIAKILKLKRGEGKIVRDYPSSPMSREYLVWPQYRVFVSGENQRIMELKSALLNPKRSLYLGQSDELVDVDISEIIEVHEIESNTFHSAVSQIIPGAILEKLPYKFEKQTNWKLDYQILTFPTVYPAIIDKNVLGYKFCKQVAQLF